MDVAFTDFQMNELLPNESIAQSRKPTNTMAEK